MRALLLLATVILAGCQSGPVENDQPVPNEAALRSRIEALFRAEQKKDWRARYELTAQAKNGTATYEQMLESVAQEDRGTTLVSWKVVSIRPQAVHDKAADMAEEAARVTMELMIRQPNGEEEVVPIFTDYWFLTDGKWYWGWRGIRSD